VTSSGCDTAVVRRRLAARLLGAAAAAVTALFGLPLVALLVMLGSGDRESAV
jgi:hypothetical protein